MDENIVARCKICKDFIITTQEMDAALANKSLGHLMAKKLAEKLGGKKGLATVKKAGLIKKDERLLGEFIKGTLLSHLSLKHMKYVLLKYPKLFGGQRAMDATKKAFQFNWEALKKYDIIE